MPASGRDLVSRLVSTSVVNEQYVWPDLTDAFGGRASGYDLLTASIDVFVPSGDSADASLYGLVGFDSGVDDVYLDYGFFIVPNSRVIQLVIDGEVEAGSVTNVFPYNTWFKVGIQVNYQTGEVVVFYNGTPVPGLSATFVPIVGASLTDVDLYSENSLNPPTSRIIFSDNYRVVLDLLIPANDNFADAIMLSGLSGQTSSINNAGASAEPGEPGHAGQPAIASLWYVWTAPQTGLFTFDTMLSSLNTQLAAYTGNALEALTEAASNDDVNKNILQSSISFAASQGTTYHIAVDGYLGGRGSVIVRWQPTPTNDNFSDALPLTGLSGQTTGSNQGATWEPGEPARAGLDAVASVWYKWTAPQRGLFVFDTVGSSFDTVLAAYTGEALEALTEIAANDDLSYRIYQSRISFTATAGLTYYIAVDGYSGDQGNILLRWRPGPRNDFFADAFVLSGVSGQTNGFNRDATAQTNEPAFSGGASVWYKWIGPRNGSFIFDTAGSSFDTLLAVYTGDSLATLREIASNDDCGGNSWSCIIFSAIEGATYYIAVDGYEGDQGDFILRVQARPALAELRRQERNRAAVFFAVGIMPIAGAPDNRVRAERPQGVLKFQVERVQRFVIDARKVALGPVVIGFDLRAGN